MRMCNLQSLIQFSSLTLFFIFYCLCSLYTGYYKKYSTTQKMTNFPFHFELAVCVSSKKEEEWLFLELYSTTILSINFSYWLKKMFAKKKMARDVSCEWLLQIGPRSDNNLSENNYQESSERRWPLVGGGLAK